MDGQEKGDEHQKEKKVKNQSWVTGLLQSILAEKFNTNWMGQRGR